jgi:hypothetical protein
MARPVEGGTRNDAGQGGAGDLAGRIEELERELQLTRAQQRELIRIVARSQGHTFRELKALLAS